MAFAIEKIVADGPLPFTMRFEESKYTDLKKKVWESEKPFPFPVHHCVLLVAYEGTEDEIQEGLEVVRRVAEEMKGTVYDDWVAEHEWQDRFYPMRIKKMGPTLVVGQAFAPIESLEGILDDFQFDQASAKAGIDGYVTSKKGVTMMGYFLEDERRHFFMLSWSQSFVIFKIAQRHGGHPHSTGIWFANYAPVYFGTRRLARIRAAKLSSTLTRYLTRQGVCLLASSHSQSWQVLHVARFRSLQKWIRQDCTHCSKVAAESAAHQVAP